MNWTKWNRIRYSIYTPIYNVVKPLFDQARKTSIEQIDLKPQEKVLIVGGGTGLDIPHLPEDIQVVFTDLTPAMIHKAQANHLKHGANITYQVEDGADLSFDDSQFDAVILHLIVAVIPNPSACLNEVDRVLKPGGKIAIMDKFRESAKPGILRRVLNPMVRLLFTDLNRKIEELTPPHWEKTHDVGVVGGRLFRAISYKKS